MTSTNPEVDANGYVKQAFFQGGKARIRKVAVAMGMDTEWIDRSKKRTLSLGVNASDRVTAEKLAAAKKIFRGEEL